MLCALSLKIVQSGNHASCTWRALSITLIHSVRKVSRVAARTPRNPSIRLHNHTTWLQMRKTTRSYDTLRPAVCSVSYSRAQNSGLTFATDKQVRDEALDSLRTYLGAQSEIKDLDLLKLWKGLFYCTLCPLPTSYTIFQCASLSAHLAY
jgi:hypothetical protein